jgi:hypothetical protein
MPHPASSAPRVTTRGFAATLHLTGAPDLPVVLLARHDAADPSTLDLAVAHEDLSLTFPIDRDLLTEGLVEGATGVDDVQVQVLGGLVLLGVADLGVSLDRQAVVEFLLATYVVAPTGSEAELVLRLDDPSEVSRSS